MNRDELIVEIKKQIQEELSIYRTNWENRIPEEPLQQVKELRDSTTVLLKENPWASVGLAAIAGFVIARFLYKRSED